MATLLANDRYQAQTRSTWISNPADGSINVTAIPDNFPTLVVLGWKTDTETIFQVTGSSGTSPTDYVLTGATRVRGANQNLPSGTTVNCVNNEDFFNQYADVVNDNQITMTENANSPGTPASGKLRLYAKTDGKWYKKDDAGVETELGKAESNDWITAADAASITIDLNQEAIKLKYKVGPLAGNRTINITNVTAGKVFLTRILQDGTGSRTLTSYGTALGEATLTIANPCVVTSNKDIRTGTAVSLATTGALPTGLTAGTVYYWIRVNTTTGNLATSKANALAGTTITTTGSQSGVHTLNSFVSWPYSLAPVLSTGKYAADDLVFVCETDGTITGTVVGQDL